MWQQFFTNQYELPWQFCRTSVSVVGTTTDILSAFISFNLYSRIGRFSVSCYGYEPKPNFSHCLSQQSKFSYLLSFFCLLSLVCWENEVNEELLDFVADIEIKYPCLNYYFLFNFHTRMMCRFYRVLFFDFVHPRKNPESYLRQRVTYFYCFIRKKIMDSVIRFLTFINPL